MFHIYVLFTPTCIWSYTEVLSYADVLPHTYVLSYVRYVGDDLNKTLLPLHGMQGTKKRFIRADHVSHFYYINTEKETK